MRRWIRHLALVVGVALAASTALAQGGAATDSTLALMDSLRGHLLSIVRDFDPAAQVTVRLKAARADLSVPGSPFVVRDVDVSGAGAAAFEEAIVRVALSSGTTMPAELTDMIREVGGEYAAKVTISTVRLSPEYLEARRAANARNSIWEQSFSQLLGDLSPVSKRLSMLGPVLDKVSPMGLLVGVLAVLAMAGGGLVVLVAVWFRSHRDMRASLDRGLSNVAAMVEQNAGGGNAVASTRGGLDAGVAEGRASAGALPSGFEAAIGALSVDSLLALVSDCYWTAQDAYGHFVWRRVPVEKKMELMRRMPVLGEYGAFLSGQSEFDMGVEQDPAYLTPLPLASVNMEELTRLVRESPSLMLRLSPLRLSSLALGLSERLALTERARQQGDVEVSPDFESIQSEPRSLKRALHIQIRNDEDELELLAMDNPDLALIEELPSLGWLLRLPSSRVEEIFRPLSAKQLASAWVGPPEVLERLAESVGPKKMEMVRSTVSRVKPRRTSPTYTMIHRMVVQELRATTVSGTAVDAEETASHAA